MWSIAEVLQGQVESGLPEHGLERLRTVARWCQDYLLHGHPEQGRGGPVCPWCPPSVARGHFYLTYASVRFSDPASVVNDLHRCRAHYLQMFPQSGPDLVLKTVVYVMSFEGEEPGSDEITDWIVRIHTTAKPEFLKRGLMLGEFYPGNAATGLRSDSFYPLRSPTPIFVIRSMVPLDIAFLSNRRDYADQYFAKFGEDAPKNIRDILSISPERLSRSGLRSLLRCLRWYGLDNASVNGLDLLTGVLPKYAGESKLAQVLHEDRTFRRLATAVVFQPRALGRVIEPGSIEHLEWLWHAAHVLRGAAGEDDFVFRDDGRLVAVLARSNPTEVEQVAHLGESVSGLPDLIGTISGRATEAVRNPRAEPWEWDGTHQTSGPELLDRAYVDLRLCEAACEPPSETCVAQCS
jgi:hypothetical protein